MPLTGTAARRADLIGIGWLAPQGRHTARQLTGKRMPQAAVTVPSGCSSLPRWVSRSPDRARIAGHQTPRLNRATPKAHVRKQVGHNKDGTADVRRSTGVSPKKHNPTLSIMPNLPPAIGHVSISTEDGCDPKQTVDVVARLSTLASLSQEFPAAPQTEHGLMDACAPCDPAHTRSHGCLCTLHWRRRPPR
jgi:hypothetical protein